MRSTCTPGDDSRIVHGSRDDGTLSSSTRVTFTPVPALRTSSSGASAVTVIDSETDGLSVIVTSAFAPTRTPIPDRVAVPYPAKSAFRLYVPGDRLRKRNS